MAVKQLRLFHIYDMAASRHNKQLSRFYMLLNELVKLFRDLPTFRTAGKNI